MMRLLLLICLLSSCTTTPILESPKDNFPIAPQLEKYETPPIVRKDADGYFIVTPVFVSNSVILKEYNDKIELWKKRHNIE